MSHWYKNCMPKIKDITSSLSIIANNIKKIKEVKNVYVWGKYAENYDKPNMRIKNLDIIVSTNLYSEDLIAANEDILEYAHDKKYLENEGFDPDTINFSKNLIELSNNNIRKWVISKDNKLLHWGPIPQNIHEFNEIEKEAEQHAIKITGKNTKKINNSSENVRKNWYNFYKNYKNNFYLNMPSGWYVLEDNVKNIIGKSLKI